MNIYYLKKFRKEAYKLYGMCMFENTNGEDIWNVGVRSQLVPSYACVASHHYTFELAFRDLNNIRREHILDKVRMIKKNKKLSIANKDLAKL